MISPPHGPDEAMLLTLAKVLEGLLMYKYQQMATLLLQEFSITISKGKGRIYKYKVGLDVVSPINATHNDGSCDNSHGTIVAPVAISKVHQTM